MRQRVPGEITPLKEVIRRVAEEAIEQCDGSVVEAARALDIGKTTLFRWRKEWRKTLAQRAKKGSRGGRGRKIVSGLGGQYRTETGEESASGLWLLCGC